MQSVIEKDFRNLNIKTIMTDKRAIVECVPNFSEGRDMNIIKQITDEIESIEGISLLNVDPGEATNRTVVTFVGSPESISEAAFRAVKKAGEVIDMRKHHGAHPRIGATDVLPLIPVSGITLEECAELARQLAKRIADEAGIPCYCYEASAFRPERKNLAVCRAGEYEALPEKLADPDKRPDFMPPSWDGEVRGERCEVRAEVSVVRGERCEVRGHIQPDILFTEEKMRGEVASCDLPPLTSHPSPPKKHPSLPKMSLDRFFLLRGWLLGANMVAFGFSFGVLSNYLAIYGKESLGITSGTGTYFMLCSIGLMLSRLQGGKALRQGRLTHNAGSGMLISLVGYTLFILASPVPSEGGMIYPASPEAGNWVGLATYLPYYGSALLIGLGNGHLWPAFQNMTICVAHNNQRGTANSTILISWDIGMGLGVLVGGFVAEAMGYAAAFWTVVLVNALGVATFFLRTKQFFLERNLNSSVR